MLVHDTGLFRVGRSDALIALALLGGVLAAYGGVGAHDFIPCDDDAYVYQNPVVRQGLTAPGFAWAFAPHVANWHPVSWLSHMLDVTLFGLEAGWHHWGNVVLHAVNAVLLFLFLRQGALLRCGTGAPWAPACVAALFALHPLHVESVAWVAERKDVLCGLFFLLSLCAYLGYARRPGVLRYLAVLLFSALAMGSKPMAVTLPGVLLLLDVWPLGRAPWPGQSDGPLRGTRWSRLVLEKLPVLALSALTSAVAVWSQAADRAMGNLATLPVTDRLANAIVSYVSYLGKALWPHDLAIFYPHPALVGSGDSASFGWRVLGAGLALLLLTALALWRSRKQPEVAVGWLWYLGMLVPVIGLVQVGEQAMADRYTYLPMIGIYIAGVWWIADAARPHGRLAQRALAVGFPLLLLALGVATRQQVAVWRDGESVFRHAIAVTENNAFAHNHLGRVYENAGKLGSAIEQYERAIEIRPSAGALSNLGNVLAKSGEPQPALARFEQALALEPSSSIAHGNLGVVLATLGRHDEAIDAYERSIALEPERATTHYNLGSLLLRTRKLERGAAQLEQALDLDPFHAGASNNLGVAYVEQGRLQEGILAYRRTLELDPDHPGTRCNLGRVHERVGDTGDAELEYQQAITLEPPCPHGHRFLGYMNFASGRFDEALVHFEQVRQLAPGADALNDLGAVHAQRRNLPAARAAFEQALRIEPDNSVARKNLERLRAEQASTPPGAAELGSDP